MSRADEKNIKALHQGYTKLFEENEELRGRIIHLENSMANLGADLANTKQLIGHLAGRGMGSTVHK